MICTIVFIYYIILYFIYFNLLATTDFFSLSVEYISVLWSCNQDFIDMLQNSLPLSTHILFGLRPDLSNIFWKKLLKISRIHNKKRIPLLNLLINCISVKSAPQILSLDELYTFRFLNFLITGLCNSFTNCSFCLISFLIADLKPQPLTFYQKDLWTIKARPLSCPSNFGILALSNALSCNVLSESVILVKSLKSL